MKIVLLSQVIEGVEFINEEEDTCGFYNPMTGDIFYLGEYDFSREEEYSSVEEGCIKMPTREEIDEEGIMQEFIETIEDVTVYNQLGIVFSGENGAHMFLETCRNFGILDDWYRYRDEKFKKIALEWCQKNSVLYQEG